MNAGLVGLTGYEVVRAGGRTRRTASSQASGQATRPRRSTSKKWSLRPDFDDEARQIITAARRRTMTSPDKLYALVSAVRYVVRHQVPGAFVECGVWRGGSMQAAALTLRALGATDRHLYLFDTFEGMPPPDEVDRRRDGRAAAELMATSDVSAPVWARAGLADVKEGMAAVGYPQDRVHYVKGLVEDTVPDQAPEQVSILRLDTDWYSSTRHELTHLYPRLSSGGVLIIDDYGYWDGSRKATEEFLDDTGARLMLIRADAGRICVKP